MDYTDKQTEPVETIPNLPTARSAEQISERAQKAFQQAYGKRRSDVHVSGSRSDKVWYLSPRWDFYLRKWPRDRIVFVTVGENQTRIQGWLHHDEIVSRMTPATNDGHDVRGPFSPMESFV